MRYRVEQWERIFSDDGTYEDVYHDIGVHDITLALGAQGMYYGKLGVEPVSMFSIDMTTECIEIHGFKIRDTANPFGRHVFVQYKLYNTERK